MNLGSEILWLSESDIEELLSMKETLSAVEKAFSLHGRGQVRMPTKIYLDLEPFNGDLRAMPAFLKGEPPAAGVKIVNSNPKNPDRHLPAVAGIMVLVDPPTGLSLAILAAAHLTSMRTGAAGGLAAKYLARSESRSVGLVGCGRQAVTQLEALTHFFPLEKALVWGKTSQEAETFVSLYQSKFKFRLMPGLDIKETCQADILVTTTPVRHPIVKELWVKPGTHINAIGADAPGKQELETGLVKKARVVVDEWKQASHAGEINVPVAQGKLTQQEVVGQLGEVIIGKITGRRDNQDLTIFDSTGLALQDVAVAQLLYDKAQKFNKGQVLKLHG